MAIVRNHVHGQLWQTIARSKIAAILRWLGVPLLLAIVLAALLSQTFSALEPRSDYLTAPVARGTITTRILASGKVNAVVTVKVGSQLSGQIADLFVDYNQHVKRGQPIARLDQQSYVARVNEATAALEAANAAVLVQREAVARARAALANAQASRAVAEAQADGARRKLEWADKELRRRHSLSQRGTASQSAFDQAQIEHDVDAAALRAAEMQQEVQTAAMDMATADLHMAEANIIRARAAVTQAQAVLQQYKVDLERTVIRAPVDGIVIGRNVERGQTVAATLEAPTLFTIAQDLRQMEIHAKIDEADIGRIKLGQNATFTVDSYPGTTFSGKVIQIRKASEAVENVITYTVLVSTENPELMLLPGMTANVEIIVAEATNALLVPNRALRFRPAATHQSPGIDPQRHPEPAAAVVWILDDAGRPSPVRIEVGITDGSNSVVLSGVREGQRVIIGEGTVDSVPSGPSLFSLRM